MLQIKDNEKEDGTYFTLLIQKFYGLENTAEM